jgi:hypothetical protein
MDINSGFTEDAHLTNPNKPGNNEAPVDPSSTSHIGTKVETGVASKKECLSEQSSEWEDVQERGIPSQTSTPESSGD